METNMKSSPRGLLHLQTCLCFRKRIAFAVRIFMGRKNSDQQKLLQHTEAERGSSVAAEANGQRHGIQELGIDY